jgi:hypothetical protein
LHLHAYAYFQGRSAGDKLSAENFDMFCAEAGVIPEGNEDSADGAGGLRQQPPEQLRDSEASPEDLKNQRNWTEGQFTLVLWEPVRRLTCRWWPERGIIETIISQVRHRSKGKRRKVTNKEVDRIVMEYRAAQSARRALGEVYRKILTIGADRLVTLTYRANVQDLKRAWLDLKRWLSLVRKQLGPYPYVAVWELQDRGAIHWHLGVPGFQDDKILRSAWWEVVGKGEGNIDIQYRPELGPIGVASYLSKYIMKDQTMWQNGQRRFRASVGIVVPKEVYILGPVSMESALATAQEVVRCVVGEAANIRVKVGGGLYEWAFVAGHAPFHPSPADTRAHPGGTGVSPDSPG